MKISPGDVVVAILHLPRERLLGIADQIDQAGLSLRSIDLSYFDEWCASIAEGEPHLRMSDNFFPMWRVERVTRDEAADGVATLAEQFEKRTGMRLEHQ